MQVKVQYKRLHVQILRVYGSVRDWSICVEKIVNWSLAQDMPALQTRIQWHFL